MISDVVIDTLAYFRLHLSVFSEFKQKFAAILDNDLQMDRGAKIKFQYISLFRAVKDPGFRKKGSQNCFSF